MTSILDPTAAGQGAGFPDVLALAGRGRLPEPSRLALDLVGDAAERLGGPAGEAPIAPKAPQELRSGVVALDGVPTAAELACRLPLPILAALALRSEAEIGGWILTGAGGVFTSTEVTRAN